MITKGGGKLNTQGLGERGGLIQTGPFLEKIPRLMGVEEKGSLGAKVFWSGKIKRRRGRPFGYG